MLKLTVPAGIHEPVPVQDGRPLESGQSYICAHRFVGQMLLTPWRVEIDSITYPLRTLLKVENWIGIKPILSPTANWNDRDLWLMRGGGWGDLLALTPVIRQIKENWPRCRLHIACGNSYRDLFYGLDVIPEMIPIPWHPLITLVSFEELIESSPKAEELHIVDLFADKAGINLSNRDIHYQLAPGEEEVAQKEFPRNSKARIAVQFLASALYRSYPQMQLVIKELAKENEVFIFGFPGQVQFKPYPNITNLMDKKLTFRESAAVLKTCDACVAPDSSLVHLCVALDVPCVALYGPIPARLRASDKVHSIEGVAPCAPCFFHADRSIDFPRNRPCTEISRCIALESISVENIVETVLSLTAVSK
jgi:ADP-heptose:LPS heptosyltransferase